MVQEEKNKSINQSVIGKFQLRIEKRRNDAAFNLNRFIMQLNLYYTLFFIKASKFCRGSMFFIIWLFQPQFIHNLFLFLWAVWTFLLFILVHYCWNMHVQQLKPVRGTFSNTTWIHYNLYVSFETILDIIINGKRCFCVFTMHITKVNYKIQ